MAPTLYQQTLVIIPEVQDFYQLTRVSIEGEDLLTPIKMWQPNSSRVTPSQTYNTTGRFILNSKHLPFEVPKDLERTC